MLEGIYILRHLSFATPLNSIMDLEYIDSGARLNTIISVFWTFIDKPNLENTLMR